MNEVEIVELVDYIHSANKDYSGWIEYLDGYDIPKVQVMKYPPIKTKLESLDIPKYKFNTVFKNNVDPKLFEPGALEFKPNFQSTIDDHPLFIVNNGYGKDFLIYVGGNIIPEYIWELDYSIPEEPEETPTEENPEEGEEELF